ncbi:MAG: serine/threonine-protein kinase [Bacteroidota bacterium]
MPKLTPAQWHRLQTLFHEVIGLPHAEEQEAYVEAQVRVDAVLGSMLRAMLEEHRHQYTLLDTPQDALSELASGAEATPLALTGPTIDEIAAASDAGRDAIPNRLGAYAIREEIGRGGMGSVYLAERADGAYEQQVAIKLLRRGLDTDDMLRRFGTERQILASLSHPNIAQLLDGGALPDGRLYFVMEYIDGLPITTYCQHHQLSLDARLALFQTVCQAVHYAHQNLIVHRDLKPQNILVTADGTVKLLDFGIAKMLSAEPHAHTHDFTARLGQQLLTPEYAAPEQIRGERITTSTDVYSLGILLVELLTGQRPYQLVSRVRREVERIICEEPPTRPSQLVRPGTEDLPVAAEHMQRKLRAGLDAIALCALRKASADRYPSAEALLQDLRSYQAGLPLHAQPDSWRYRAHLFARRHKVALVAGSLVLISLVAGLSVALWQAGVAASERQVAQDEAARAQAVKSFLVRSFRASQPGATRSDTMTVGAWLDASARQVDTTFTDAPELRREMLLTLGDVYRSMGRFDEALTYQEQAHAITQTMHALNTEARAYADYHLGRLYYDRGSYASSDSLLASALQQYEYLDSDPQATAQAREAYANTLYYHAGKLERALDLHRQNLAYYESLDAPSLSLLGATQDNVSRLELALGHVEAARTYAAASVATRRQIPDGDLMLALGLNNLGLLQLYDPVDYARGEQLFRESMTLHRKAYAKDHYRTTFPMFPLAEILWIKGEREEAKQLVADGMRIRRAQYPEGHFMVAEGLLTLGNMLKDEARYADARAAYEESYNTYVAARGLAYHRTQETRDSLAVLLRLMERRGEAAALYAATPTN